MTSASSARTGKGRSFYLVSVLDGSVKAPRPGPARRGAGALPARRRAHAGLRRSQGGGLGHLEARPRERALTNLTQDAFADNNPQVSPDGRLVAYERRISGHSKLYAFPLAEPAQKTQLTFGPFDDQAPYFSSDGTKIYYA